jgi:peptidoglycan/LPS O-acetylase OafA/YrhL
MTKSQPPRLHHVREMDGLRGILALWVALVHVSCWSGHAEASMPEPLAGCYREFINARTPVEIFIILSGFAISFLLNERRPSYVSFMAGRVFRIYPVFLICLALGVATTNLSPFILESAPWRDSDYFVPLRSVSVQEHANVSAHIWAHLTLLNGVIPESILPDATATLLPPAWSITLEWQYYLLAPLVARLVRLNLGIIVLGVVGWAGLQYGDLWRNPFPAFFPTHLTLFLIGIGSYHLLARMSECAEKQTASAFRMRNMAFVAIAALAWWFSIAVAAWTIVFGCVVAAGDDAFGKGLRAVRGLLLFPALQWLGRISFPLYLVHWPVIIFLVRLILEWDPTISSGRALMVMLGLGVPLILLTAYGVHRYIEAPMMALGKRVSGRRPSVAIAAQTAGPDDAANPSRSQVPQA